jgi:putative PEP-CTERM system TPR-repeat lipoprotein
MTSARALIVLLAVAFSVACSNPEKEKVEHVRKGDQYVRDKKDEFAVIEYASAVNIDPKYGDAHWKLAQTYERLGNLRAAAPAFIRAADALPDNRQAQIKAIEILLLARQFDDAKARAEKFLTNNAQDEEVRILRANAMAGGGDVASAFRELDEVLTANPGQDTALLTLGAIYQQRGESKKAEEVFRKAVDVDPSSAGAKLALASLLAGSAHRSSEAEEVLGEVLAKEPKNLLANRMLADIYLATQRVKDAENPLKVIAEATPDPAPRFQLADYYVANGKMHEGVEIFTALSKDSNTFAEAEVRLAVLDYSQTKTEQAHRRIDALLVRIPNYSPAITLKARWLLAENKLDAALDRANKATAAAPQSVEAQMVLALTRERRGETSAAIKAYSEALRLNPGTSAAQAALSRVKLASGQTQDAVRFGQEAKRSQPNSLDARVALVRSLLATGDLARADIEIAELQKGAPNAAIVHVLQGALYLARRNTAAARRSFERAVELAPGLTEAVIGLAALDLQTNAPAAAIARLEAEIAKEPNNIGLLATAARAYVAAGDIGKAEQRLRRAVTIDPGFANGYSLLAQLYVKQGKLKEARAEFQSIADRDPTAVGARTLVGMLFEAEGRVEEAKKVYEGLVGGTVDAPVAANNLAYIYAEQGANLDIALQLATSAKPKLPDNPNVDDTIGWVYYKKELASLAVGPLEASLAKRPNNPEVMTHLGLAYAKVGNRSKARELLVRARALNAQAGGAEAERVLASLQ